MGDPEIPYDELDPPVSGLVRALNELPGLRTISSCGGHENPETEASRPADSWYVDLVLDTDDWDADVWTPTAEAWVSLEFLAWLVYDAQKARRNLWLEPYARPPYLNQPGRGLVFQLAGGRNEPGGQEPTELASYLIDTADRYYIDAENAGAQDDDTEP